MDSFTKIPDQIYTGFTSKKENRKSLAGEENNKAFHSRCVDRPSSCSSDENSSSPPSPSTEQSQHQRSNSLPTSGEVRENDHCRRRSSREQFTLIDLGHKDVAEFFQRQVDNRRHKMNIIDLDVTEVQPGYDSGHKKSPKSRKTTKAMQTDKRTPKIEISSKTKGGRKLWQFVLGLLCDPDTNPSVVRWLDVQQGIFIFVQSGHAASLWGRRRGHPTMTYEHMSRAIRHYYKRKVIMRVPGKRLVYQFGPNAYGWRSRVEASPVSSSSSSLNPSTNRPITDQDMSVDIPEDETVLDPVNMEGINDGMPSHNLVPGRESPLRTAPPYDSNSQNHLESLSNKEVASKDVFPRMQICSLTKHDNGIKERQEGKIPLPLIHAPQQDSICPTALNSVTPAACSSNVYSQNKLGLDDLEDLDFKAGFYAGALGSKATDIDINSIGSVACKTLPQVFQHDKDPSEDATPEYPPSSPLMFPENDIKSDRDRKQHLTCHLPDSAVNKIEVLLQDQLAVFPMALSSYGMFNDPEIFWNHCYV